MDRRRFIGACGGVCVSSYTLDIFRKPPNYEEEARSVTCPVYMFHEVSSIRSFSRFIADSLERGFYPVSLTDLTNYLETGSQTWPPEQKPFMLTFDDGLLSQKVNAVPVLLERQLPAVFAVMPNWEGDGVHRYMTMEDVKELAGWGFEIACHTFNHPNLPRLKRFNRGAWESEIIESKQALEDLIGKTVEFFCYPEGAYDQETILVVSQNYRAALAKRGFNLQKSTERFILPRQRMS